MPDEESRAPRKKKRNGPTDPVNGIETGVQVSLGEPDQAKELEIVYDRARELGLAVLRSEATPQLLAAEANPELKKAEKEKAKLKTLGPRVVSLKESGILTIARKMDDGHDEPANQ